MAEVGEESPGACWGCRSLDVWLHWIIQYVRRSLSSSRSPTWTFSVRPLSESDATYSCPVAAEGLPAAGRYTAPQAASRVRARLTPPNARTPLSLPRPGSPLLRITSQY